MSRLIALAACALAVAPVLPAGAQRRAEVRERFGPDALARGRPPGHAKPS